MYTNNEEKIPYRLSNEEIDLIVLAIGNTDYKHMDPNLKGVNDEIGIAKTREVLSEVQNKVLSVIGNQDKFTTLFLSDNEINALLLLDLKEEIKEILEDGIS